MRRNRAAFCSIACYRRSQIGRPAHNKGLRLAPLKLCDNCGESFRGKTRARFCSQRCAGAFFSGPGHPGWRGGVTDERRRLFNSRGYREWRAAVLARDGGRCRWCALEGVMRYRQLELHHIVPVSVLPEAIFDVGNAVTLCSSHHGVTRGVEEVYAARLAEMIGEPLLATAASSLATRRRLQTVSAA